MAGGEDETAGRRPEPAAPRGFVEWIGASGAPWSAARLLLFRAPGRLGARAGCLTAGRFLRSFLRRGSRRPLRALCRLGLRAGFLTAALGGGLLRGRASRRCGRLLFWRRGFLGRWRGWFGGCLAGRLCGGRRRGGHGSCHGCRYRRFGGRPASARGRIFPRTTGTTRAREDLGLFVVVLLRGGAGAGAGFGFVVVFAVIRFVGVIPEALVALVQDPAPVLVFVFVERTAASPVAQVVGF